MTLKDDVRRGMKWAHYAITLAVFCTVVVAITYVWWPEFSVIGFVLIACASLEIFSKLNDQISNRAVSTDTELNRGNIAVAIVVVGRYLAFAIIIAAALLGVPKAAGAEMPPVVKVARQYLFQLETNGNNRSPFIDSCNREAGIPLGSPNCASTVSRWLRMSGAIYPTYRGGYSRAFVTKESLTLPLKNWIDLTGWLLVFRRNGGGHIGVIESGSVIVKTIEANTSSGESGSQWNGGGIFPRTRNLKQLSSPYNVFRATHVTPVRYA